MSANSETIQQALDHDGSGALEPMIAPPRKPKFLLSVDAESWGVMGDIFWIGAVVYDEEGKEVGAFSASVDPFLCSQAEPEDTDLLERSNTRVWLTANVFPHMKYRMHLPNGTIASLRDGFWAWFQAVRANGEVHLLADCGLCIESRLLVDAIKDKPERLSEAPWFVHDVATALHIAGRDPTGTYARRANEVPAHDPVCDARQTARLFAECGGWALPK
jgi:hypothetical protein